ncbi:MULTISPECIES: serine protease [unclassified Streptomyces]|uniref:S1 family peptidase n=1 Tax=unclassified Streptomyces TaxID=2593676 RepID=UPI00278C44DB|nr:MULTISPECIES: serine protease [unclassified Streptomyces]
MPQPPIGVHPRIDQVVEVLSGGAYGTGYRISKRLVVTARHVVPEGSAITVRSHTGDVTTDLTAEVAWRAEAAEVDIVLLRLSGAVPRTVLAPVAFGDLTLAPTTQVDFEAIGFPAHKAVRLLDDVTLRDTDHVLGTIPAGANAKAGVLDLLHPGRVHTMGDAWKGMSGAAVFARDHLVGVVTEAERADVPLRALPVTLAVGWREGRKRVPEPARSVRALRSVLAADGVPARPEPVRLRTAYGSHIRNIVGEAGDLLARRNSRAWPSSPGRTGATSGGPGTPWRARRPWRRTSPSTRPTEWTSSPTSHPHRTSTQACRSPRPSAISWPRSPAPRHPCSPRRRTCGRSGTGPATRPGCGTAA